MPQFHPLTVRQVRKTIRDAVVVTLEPDDPAVFRFVPGQYLTFRREFDGIDLRRSYSICAGLDEDRLEVAIKRVEDGAFSVWANQDLRPGDVLWAMPPMGKFHTTIDPDQARHYLAFAGGSGITPILSIVKTLLTREPQARVTLVYANRAVNTIMFREELEDLKNQHMTRLSVLHVLESDSQEIDLFTGRVDAEKCAGLFAHWIDPRQVDLAFICGPEPMMLAIAASLRAHGLSKEKIKFELFASAQSGRRPQRAVADSAKADTQVSVAVKLDGATRNFTMSRHQTLLEAALEAAIDPPHACKAGVCSTCRAKVTHGEVEMVTNHALEDYEVEQGYVLTCQCYPLTDEVAFDYDH